MASIKNLKKDINYVLGDIIDECLVTLTGDTKNSEAIVEEAIVIFDDLIAKVNAKDVENKKAHFKAVEAELEDRAGKLLKKVNKIIHSKVAHHFKKWVDKQNGVYCIKETAILFESASYKLCDYTILITSPKEERLKRVKNRDQLTRKEIENRMNHQWSDIEKSQLADVVIENVHLKNTQKKVEEVHLFLLKRFD